MDENVQCAPLPNTKDIVTSIIQQPGETNESDDDTGDPLPAVTYSEAYSAILKIRSFPLRSYESDEHYHLLNKLESDIQTCGSNASAQSLITDFFHTT